MRADIPAEVIFLVAILLTVVSLIIYGLIIRRLLVLIRGKGIWVFPVLAGVLLVCLAFVHVYRMLLYFPHLGTAGPSDLFDLIVGSLVLSRIESLMLLGAGICALVGGIMYYAQSSK